VRNSLRALKGVKSVEVDYELEQAFVEYSDAEVQPQAMIKATTDVGFPASVQQDETAQ
jgi:copper chaperone CopZ